MAERKKAPVKPRRGFTAEFKLEAVRRAAERHATGVPHTQIARELGIAPGLLRNWARQISARHGARPMDVFPGHGQLPSDEAEVRRLEREVRRMTQENAFLKTAAVDSMGQRNTIVDYSHGGVAWPGSVVPVYRRRNGSRCGRCGRQEAR